ncbi:S-protein homolog 5-like [Lactuca sativa]|uniref:S-protein homolog 5-like n=1 Tax=Lactuca sativa TaxID=4236 RepID=UPI000CD88430|nr:S-protein homolog 5-like [Lactuca sativa]
MRYSTIYMLFFFSISTFSITSIAHFCITPKWNVYVINTISGDIVAHIKSGDDDLGNHTIPFNGNYNWSFCDKLGGSTLFYGDFWWGSRFQTLTLFDEEIEMNVCYLEMEHNTNCYWFVKPDGFYISAYPNPSGDKLDIL